MRVETMTIRGAMNLVTLGDLEALALMWIEGDDDCVLRWEEYEAEACKLFGLLVAPHSEVMHGIMTVVCAAVAEAPIAVKLNLRSLGPQTLDTARMVLGHLQLFRTMLDAEICYRAGTLASDWTMRLEEPGRLVVRSEHKPANKERTH